MLQRSGAVYMGQTNSKTNDEILVIIIVHTSEHTTSDGLVAERSPRER